MKEFCVGVKLKIYVWLNFIVVLVGVYVANRASDKITQLTDNVYVCRSGSVLFFFATHIHCGSWFVYDENAFNSIHIDYSAKPHIQWLSFCFHVVFTCLPFAGCRFTDCFRLCALLPSSTHVSGSFTVYFFDHLNCLISLALCISWVMFSRAILLERDNSVCIMHEHKTVKNLQRGSRMGET